MPKLVIHHPKGDPRDHELVDDVTTIGRGSGNIIQVKDKEASRNHCRVEKSEDGFRLVDLGSRNGTKVNETKVKNQALRNGDKIRIGDFVLAYEDPNAPTAEDLGATVDVAPLDEKTVVPAEGKPKYVLDIAEGRDKGKVLELGPDTFTIGRNSSNKYVIDDESASSFHAEISREPTGFFVTDLGSTNGTKVGGEKIVKTRLSPGSDVTIGTTKMIFKNVGAKSDEDEVFGTVVLDTERLERELAEDEASSRAVFLRRLALVCAALAVVALVVVFGVFVGQKAGTPRIEGNLVDNFSFDRGVSQKGDPEGWKSVGNRYTPWQVLTDVDRVEESTSMGTLQVQREEEATPDEYAECYTPVDVATDRSYVLGGWIRTDNAQGAYGFRVRWIGPDERQATAQVFVMGAQTVWRKIERVVAPPSWARRAEVVCFAYGNRGKVYFDDVCFKPEAIAEVPDFDVAYERVRIEPTASGEFDVKSGTEYAIRNGRLFLVSAQDAESTQQVADPEEPQREKNGTTFKGTIPEFVDFVNVRYEERVRPGEFGIVVEYELRSDRPLPLVRAGLRFLVTGALGAGELHVFGADGKPLRRTTGLIRRAREIVFTTPEGEKLAVYLRSEQVAFRIEPLGEQKQVEVIWPGQVTVGKTPSRLAVEFNTGSRFERIEIDTALGVVEEARRSKDAAAEHAALQAVIEMGERFPKEAEQAQKELDALTQRVEGEMTAAMDLLEQVKVAPEGESRETLDKQLKERIEALKAKYTTPPFSERVAELERERVGAITEFARREKEVMAQQTFDRIIDFIKKENAPFASALWKQFKDNFSDTEAFKKAQQHDVQGMLESLERRLIELDASYRRLEPRIRMLLTNNMAKEALRQLETDANYRRFKDNPRFQELRERIMRRLEGGDRP